MKALVQSNEVFKIVPNFCWEFSNFRYGLLLDFLFPNVSCFARILIKHLDSILQTCRFFITHSECKLPWLPVFLLHAIFRSLFSLVFCLASFLGPNMHVWISALNCCMSTEMDSQPERGMTSWNSWVSFLSSKCWSITFCLSGIP